tara:strand:+ start:2941 stop:3207 length:267 start_codon:yes stop_codon:yes gene_type:complete
MSFSQPSLQSEVKSGIQSVKRGTKKGLNALNPNPTPLEKIKQFLGITPKNPIQQLTSGGKKYTKKNKVKKTKKNKKHKKISKSKSKKH